LHLLEAQSTEDQLKRQDAQAEARVLRAEVELLRRQVAALQEQLDESGSQCEVRHQFSFLKVRSLGAGLERTVDASLASVDGCIVPTIVI
jgi:hypothetical protein